MKTLKKTLGVVLAFAMVLSMFAVAFTSFAATTIAELVPSTTDALTTNGEITISVKAKTDMGAFWGGLSFNSTDFQVTNVTSPVADEFSAVTLPSNFSDDLTDTSTIQLTGKKSGTNNMTDKVLLIITLKVLKADAGSLDFTFIPDELNCCNNDGDMFTEPTIAAASFTMSVATTGLSFADTTEATLVVNGDTTTITREATRTPAGANDGTLTYTSSNEAVAIVDTAGKVTAVGQGTATITATAGDKTASYDVKVVKAATAADITPATILGTETAADTYAYTATGKFAPIDVNSLFSLTNGADGFKVEATAAADGAVTVTDGKITFAKVSEDPTAVTVIISAVQADGTVGVIATKTINVIVNEAPATAADIQLNAKENNTNLVVGDSSEVSFVIKAGSITTDALADLTNVAYASSDEKVLTVDANGVVKAIGVGTADVILTATNSAGDDIEVKLAYTVTAVPVTPEEPVITPEEPTTDDKKPGSNNSIGANTGDTGVALAATLSLAAAAAYVFTKKRG